MNEDSTTPDGGAGLRGDSGADEDGAPASASGRRRGGDGGDGGRKMTGLERLQYALDQGYDVPIIGRTLNFHLIEVSEGRAVFAGTPVEAVLNTAGTAHGGWMAAIMDSALACAVHTVLGPDETATTAEFKVNLVRPVLIDTGEVVCESRLISRGRRLGVSDCTLKDRAGTLYAHGTETCLIMAKSERRT